MNKLQPYLSLACNLAIIPLVFFAVRASFMSGTANMDASRFQSLRYFTILSNIFAALGALLMLPFSLRAICGGRSAPLWVISLKYMSTLSVSVTLFTVLLFLGPTQGYKRMFADYGLSLHAIVPLLALLTYCMFESSPSLPFRSCFLSLVPTVLYGIVYLLMVVVYKRWPDFYGFTFGGKLQFIPLSMLAMFAGSYGLGLGVWKLRELIHIAIH